MKFICNGCANGQGDPCIVDVGKDWTVSVDDLRCVIRNQYHACKWEKYEDSKLANLQPTCNNLATNLQDNSLPKLTAEVFNRPDCPIWAKYAAVDGCGRGFYYEAFPRLYKHDRFFLLSTVHGKTQRIPGTFDGANWINSIVIRQEKPSLPDWCKVAAYLWNKSEERYYKITKISSEIIEAVPIGNRGFGLWHVDDFANRNVQSRLRPYNAEEMKALVGKIICEANASHVATTCIHHAGTDYLRLGIHLYEAEELISKGFTIDGKPCAILEHLEDGEWVR